MTDGGAYDLYGIYPALRRQVPNIMVFNCNECVGQADGITTGQLRQGWERTDSRWFVGVGEDHKCSVRACLRPNASGGTATCTRELRAGCNRATAALRLALCV